MNYTYSNLLSLTTLQQKKTKKRVYSLRRMGRKCAKTISKPQEGSQGSMKTGPKGNHHHRIAHEFWTSYFGHDTPKNKAKAVEQLGKWKDLKVCGIPDSGTDICTLAGNAWIIGKAPGPKKERKFYGYGAPERTFEVVHGETCYLSPDGRPLAILRVNYGLAVPDNSESLLAEAHLQAMGIEITSLPGTVQLSKVGWPIAVHCLPRGNGHFLPIRLPTKEELGTLPTLTLMPKDCSEEALLRQQVDMMFSDVSCSATMGSLPTNHKRKRGDTQATVRQVSVSEEETPPADEPVPQTGEQSNKPEAIIKALSNWAEIFCLSDMQRLVKTLRANTAEAVELECENRTIPRRIMKARFPYLRPRFLGEECYTDTIQYRTKGKAKYLQAFYTRHSRLCKVYNVPGVKAAHLVGAYEKFTRDVGVPTIWISDQAQAENWSGAVKKFAGKYHVKLATSEAWQQCQNSVERMIGTLKSRVEHIRQVRRVPSKYTGYLYRFVAHTHNHTVNRKLNDQTPIEAYSGETGDISHLCYAFFDPVWYSPGGSGDSDTMLRGWYLGPAESTGNEITHHILPVKVVKGREVAIGERIPGRGIKERPSQRLYSIAMSVPETQQSHASRKSSRIPGRDSSSQGTYSHHVLNIMVCPGMSC